jgi:hypothetical protein
MTGSVVTRRDMVTGAIVMSAALTPAIRAAAALPAPPPPDGSQPFVRGPYDVAVNTCQSELVRLLRREFGSINVQRLQVPAESDWTQLVSHYQNALGDGWQVESHPEQQASCNLRAWTHKGQHFAIGLTRESFEGDGRFRVLLVLSKADR